MNIDYIALFQSYLFTEKRLSKNSVSAYVTDVKQLAVFLEKKYSSAIHVATGEQLKSYVRSLHTTKAQPRTIARKISAFKVFYAFLAERYGLANESTVLVMPKIDKSLPIYLTHDEIRQLIQSALTIDTIKGKRNALMLQLLYATGLRITELVTLKLENIHFDTGFLNVFGKGGRQRDIPLPLPVCELLSSYVREMLPVILHGAAPITPKMVLFPSIKKGKVIHMTRQSFWVTLKKLLVIAGIRKNVSPHTLRHSLATHLLQAGADIRSLQLWLGHEQMSTVEIYTHLDKNMVRKSYDRKHPRA